MANDVLTASLSPVVEIASGKIRGAVAGGIHAFKGIPYGASTSGTNRFLPPQPGAPWAGTRDALAYHGQAPQSPAQVKAARRDGQHPRPRRWHAGGRGLPDAQRLDPGAAGKRPVMVWLHGGAFAYGSGNRAVTEGANLARRGDVVVVSVNHRLNICGYLHLGRHRRRALRRVGQCRLARHGRGARMGARQHRRVWRRPRQRHDLRRVGRRRKGQRAAGDAGGEGLFHRAVIQSGAAVRFTTRERANALAEGGAEAARRQRCDKLADVPLDKLLGAIVPASRAAGPRAYPLLDRYDFGPVVDGAVVTQHPCRADAPRRSATTSR
jgi:para-nitrobenzyl esterase